MRYVILMNDFDQESPPGRKPWQLDRAALDALLETMAPDRETAGCRYEELRRRLINLFAWEHCEAPDDLADEVLNRLARKTMEGVEIPHLDRFAFGIARLVIQEEGRKRRSRQTVLREFQASGQGNGSDSRGLAAIELCLAALPPDRRELIERYYGGDRSALARELGISINALRNRALRIREELYNCVLRKRDDS
jgi:DNA-directed RNA polymerase specialized sigma24 family protein